MADVLLVSSLKVRHNLPLNLNIEDLIDFDQEIEYSTYDSYLREKGKVTVSSDSVIYRNGVADSETIVGAQYLTYYRYRHFIKKRLFSTQVRLAKGNPYLFVTDQWSMGHFHWICDTLPRIWLIRDKTKLFSLLLPDLPYFRTVALESFDLLGLKFKEIIWLKEDAFYHVPELYFVSPLHRSGHFHPGVMKEIKEKFLMGLHGGDNRIYISRGKQKVRKIVNEHELLPILKEYKFDVIYGEEFTLKEQLKLISDANILMGIHGAGLANAIFQQSKTNLVELRVKENAPSNVGYWHLADAMDINYYYYNGMPDSDLPLVGKGGNLVIDINGFEKKLLNRFGEFR